MKFKLVESGKKKNKRGSKKAAYGYFMNFYRDPVAAIYRFNHSKASDIADTDAVIGDSASALDTSASFSTGSGEASSGDAGNGAGGDAGGGE